MTVQPLARLVATAGVLLAAAVSLHAQTITFDIVRPPLGQLGFEDLWNITFHNPTTRRCTVCLYVEADDTSSGLVFSARTKDMALAPGEGRITAQDIELVDIRCMKGYEAFAAPESALPEGDYFYEVLLLPGMSQHTFLFQVRCPRPLELVWPTRGAAAQDSLPLFAWKSPVVPGYAGEYLYSVRVSEMRRGQSCSLATNSEATIVEHGRSSQTAWRYPSTAKKLVPGRTYAWRVEARDSTLAPVGAGGPMMKAGTFVYRPGRGGHKGQVDFEFPRAGAPVYGKATLRIKADIPDADLCVLEYAFGPDSTRGDWQVVGCFPKAQELFVGTWDSDSAVTRERKAFGSPCALKATALGRRGQYGESVMETVVNRPPARTRRGCGCR